MARVRSLAAAFESSSSSSPSSSPSKATAPALPSQQQLGDLHSCDSEADAAVLIASSCVRQLTEEWEGYSSAGGSECCTPTAAASLSGGQQHPLKPVSRPVTPAAAFSPAAATTPEASTAAVAVAGDLMAAVASGRVPHQQGPAAAALLSLRQDSGPVLDLLMPLYPTAMHTSATTTASSVGATDSACERLSCVSEPRAAVVCDGTQRSDNTAAALNSSRWCDDDAAPTAQREEMTSVLCRAAVWAGLVSDMWLWLLRMLVCHAAAVAPALVQHLLYCATTWLNQAYALCLRVVLATSHADRLSPPAAAAAAAATAALSIPFFAGILPADSCLSREVHEEKLSVRERVCVG